MAKKKTAKTASLDGMPAVQAAIRDARIEPDERGLMPLTEARRWLDARTVYAKGDGEMIDGTFVLESDRSWAALLSLEDAAELVKQASRLEWRFHVRGRDNLAPFERYGDGILPWLRARVKKHVLYNVPWCVLPCLIEIASEEALLCALEARAVHELLPGQPALGGGPGAFAHDETERGNAPVDEVAPEEARTLLGVKEGLDVARAWLAKHPDMVGAVEKLAAGGNERAAALLEDVRAAASLPANAQAILDEAETIDEPPGPAWTIGELDEAATNYDLPIWDNAYYTMAAMKVSGFASREGDVLFVECFSTSTRHQEWLSWSGYAYGPGAVKRSSGQELADVKGDELEDIELTESDYVSGVSSHLHLFEDDESRIVPVPLPMEEQILTLKRPITGKKVTARSDWHLPRSFAELGEADRKELEAVSQREALLVAVAARHPEVIFADEAELLKRCKGDGDGDARRLFSFTSFQWPAAGEPASGSVDLRTMVAAIRARKKITRLPGTPNSRPEHWLPICAALRNEGSWPDGESPIAPEMAEGGPGVTPYWSWLIARGYPHGAMVMHAAAWNQKGMAEQTVPYLVNAAAPAMQVFWPRRAATMWVRAVGSPKKKWAADDAGVAKASADDSILRTKEAAKLVAKFVAKDFGAPRHVGSDFVDALEALVGGAQTIAMFAVAMKDAETAADHPSLAGALFELGFILRRFPGTASERDKAAKRLAKLLTKSMLAKPTDVTRALDLVANGRVGAERSARTEIDYAFVEDAERGWAKERILAAAPSRPSAYLIAIAGDALIDKYVARAADEDSFLAAQLAKLGSDRAVDALLELHAHEKMRAGIKQAFAETRPDGQRELTHALDGRHASAARATLEAMGVKA